MNSSSAASRMRDLVSWGDSLVEACGIRLRGLRMFQTSVSCSARILSDVPDPGDGVFRHNPLNEWCQGPEATVLPSAAHRPGRTRVAAIKRPPTIAFGLDQSLHRQALPAP